jgi:hypothetical protein
LTIKLGSLVKFNDSQTAEVVILFERDGDKLGEFRAVVISGKEAKGTDHFFQNYLGNLTEVIDATALRFEGGDEEQTEDSRLYNNRDKSCFYKSICDLSVSASRMQAAASLLTLNSVPSCLVGREDEADRLLKFLKNALRNEGSQSSLCKPYFRYVWDAWHRQDSDLPLRNADAEARPAGTVQVV